MLERLFGSKGQPALVSTAFDDFSDMLAQAARMYDLALAALLDGVALDADLDEMDDEIDGAEAAIRRGVLEHLSVSPRRDLVASLVLISMVQDAERIGDFARGLGEVRLLTRRRIDGPFADELRRYHEEIRPRFGDCATAFRNDDAERAQAVVDAHSEMKPRLSDFIARVAASDLSADMAIVFAITARNLQRISAHLSNIASSVVQPFHLIRHDDDDED